MLAAVGVTNGVPVPSINGESLKFLPALLTPQIRERFTQEANDFFKYSCGHWCDADMALLRQRIAEQLHLPPSQLGEIRLGETERMDPSLNPSWDGAVIAYLTKPDQIRSMANSSISKADADHESMFGSLVVMRPVSEATFRSSVKLMVIPVLHEPRPAWEYYIISGLAEALVSPHRAGSFLGIDFFRARTSYPLWWHGFVWACLGSAALTLLAMPLLWKPMLWFVDAIGERPFETGSPQKTIAAKCA